MNVLDNYTLTSSPNTTNTTGYCQTYYPYTPSPTYTYITTSWPDTAQAEKIAALQGEVKVLREMVAALVAGRSTPQPRRKKSHP